MSFLLGGRVCDVCVATVFRSFVLFSCFLLPFPKRKRPCAGPERAIDMMRVDCAAVRPAAIGAARAASGVWLHGYYISRNRSAPAARYRRDRGARVVSVLISFLRRRTEAPFVSRTRRDESCAREPRVAANGSGRAVDGMMRNRAREGLEPHGASSARWRSTARSPQSVPAPLPEMPMSPAPLMVNRMPCAFPPANPGGYVAAGGA